jgi:hypothetical protein
MATRHPESPRGRELQREVSLVIQRQIQDGCQRAWVEIAGRFAQPPLLPEHDATTAAAHRAIRALVAGLTHGLTRIAMAALLLNSGLRRNGHVAGR